MRMWEINTVERENASHPECIEKMVNFWTARIGMNEHGEIAMVHGNKRHGFGKLFEWQIDTPGANGVGSK